MNTESFSSLRVQERRTKELEQVLTPEMKNTTIPLQASPTWLHSSGELSMHYSTKQ